MFMSSILRTAAGRRSSVRRGSHRASSGFPEPSRSVGERQEVELRPRGEDGHKRGLAAGLSCIPLRNMSLSLVVLQQ